MLKDGMEMGQQKNAASFRMSRLIQTSSMFGCYTYPETYVQFNLPCIICHYGNIEDISQIITREKKNILMPRYTLMERKQARLC